MFVKSYNQKIKEIAKKYDLDLLLLFGSQVKDKKYLHQESDFDVAYLSKRNLDLMEEARLICDLMPIFGSERVDLANIKRAGPLLLKQIFEAHKVLFCRDLNIYYQYKIYAIRKYIEAKPLFELERRYINKTLKKL